MQPGTQLGTYEILSPLGKGGMGEVWRARDSKLGREVAIKTLPEEFARDEERLARFEREAKLLASMNHPNIATIHGFEEDNGTRFLVLELVEGDTLADRIKRGAIPLAESLEIGRQITDALEAAHEKGVIHRDLKPANIKITPDGKVKVLDFGLAKAFAGDGADPTLSNSPTLSMAATQAGTILGTAAYMAPEQARGKTVDKRADIWAFGVVLYEMVTGKGLFHGEDLTQTVASVVMKEADLEQAPVELRRLLAKCLEKDPKDRLRDIGDVWELRDDPQARGAGPSAQAETRRGRLPWVAAAVFALATVALATLWLRPAPLPEVMRFEIHAPPGSSLVRGNPAVSPDGGTLAYTLVDPDGATRIHVRPIDSVQTRPLTGTEGGMHPFWAPDGRSLAFWADGYLLRIDLEGGAPRRLGESGAPWHGTWSQNGNILFSGRDGGMVSEDGGTVTEFVHGGFPAFLPDGERFLGYRDGSVQLGRLGSDERTVVLEDASGAIPAPAPNGKTYLLFVRGSNLMVQEFDEVAGNVVGNAVLLVPDILRLAVSGGLPAVGVSPTGILAYRTGTGSSNLGQLTWVDRSGQEVGTLSPDDSVGQPRISPDGRFAADVRTHETGQSIWVTDLVRESVGRLTFGEETRENNPVWSPDGARVAYRNTSTGIHIVDVSGGGNDVHVTDVVSGLSSWSPDGRYLLTRLGGTLNLQPVDGDEEPIEVGSRNGDSSDGRFSPDGKYIAFSSDESGRSEVYVQPMPSAAAQAGQVQISIDGGSQPRWSSDGTELFFYHALSIYSREFAMMAVDVEPGETFSAGIPRELFRQTSVAGSFDVHPDGERFLILKPAPGEAEQPITVVLNWWVEMEERNR